MVDVSGFDMGKTIGWYRRSGVSLPVMKLGRRLPFLVKYPELIALSDGELGGLFNLLPKNAQNRSIAVGVTGKPEAWFHKDSIKGKPIPTSDPALALSPSSIIPSYIDYSPWSYMGRPAANIWLYKLPDDMEESIARIVIAEGFLHEVGHSIVQPAFYVNDHLLRFPDGSTIQGTDAMLRFAELSEKYPPISHYASAYRGRENKFESDVQDYDPRVAISEELCENIAAYILGFSYSGDESRDVKPFADRDDVYSFVRDFLNAERLSPK